jgi:predicted patatin/cPLA2 family phospholipase
MVLTHPRGYRRKPSRFGATFHHWSHRRHPAVGRALSARGTRGNASLDVIDALEDAGEIEVIRPPVTLPARRLSRSRRAILETLEVGFQAGRDWLARHPR